MAQSGNQYGGKVSTLLSQTLSRISFFVGMASLAGWLLLFLFWAADQLDRGAPLPEIVAYVVVGGVVSAASLGVIGLVPVARNTHGLPALASVAVAALNAAFLTFLWGDLSAIAYVLTDGIYGGFQTIAAIVAFILAALSFSGMKGTPVFGGSAHPPIYGEGQSPQRTITSPPVKGFAMQNLGEARAMLFLWIITIANLGGGLFLWIVNFLRLVEAEIDQEGRDSRSNWEYEEILESAAEWQLFAVPFIEFGILVLVITLATTAIVSSGKRASGERT